MRSRALMATLTVSAVAVMSLSSSATAAAGPAAATSPRRATTPAQWQRHELVWVASADSGPVTAYAVDSSGAVNPVRGVENPNLPNTVWDPWNVTFGASGALYVQSFLSDATTFVFGPHLFSGSKPIRIFKFNGPDNRGIAVDSKGYEYVAGGEAAAIIGVEPPDANGQPANFYSVAPVRTMQPGGSFDPWPSFLTSGPSDDVIAGVTLTDHNAIEIFRGGTSPRSTPVRRIEGHRTDLGACSSTCDQLAITYSPLTNDIFVAVSSATGASRILVFSAEARGNAAPVRVISGSQTGLTGEVITGIAVSQHTGDIFAMVKASEFGPGEIEQFAPWAAGDDAPLSSFTDGHDGFADALGIAVH